MERFAAQLEALYVLGPRSVAALAACSRRCREATALEDHWWFFLAAEFLIFVEPNIRARTSISARSLYLAASRCGLSPISPWQASTAEDLVSIATTLVSAEEGVAELRSGPPVLGGGGAFDGKSGGASDNDEEAPVRPRVFMDAVRFDPEALGVVLERWQNRDEAGLQRLPGPELVSDCAELLEDEEESSLVRIALSVSFAKTTSAFVPDDDDIEYDPLAEPGAGRLLALNLVFPEDDHCAVYLAHSDFPVQGRWAWNSEEFKLNPGDSAQVPRRLFQARGRPEGEFQRFLRLAATGAPIRVLVISTGVGAEGRDGGSGTSGAEECEERILDKLYTERSALQRLMEDDEETLFGMPMDMPRPWPDLGSSPRKRSRVGGASPSSPASSSSSSSRSPRGAGEDTLAAAAR